MNRNDYGQKAEIIGQLTDVNQLMGLLRNPQYAGFTNVIIARLTELNKARQAPQAQQPPTPTVAQQAVSGQAPPDQPAMAAGGIVAFKHGGEVRKFAKGGKPSLTERAARWLGMEPRDEEPDQPAEAAPTDGTPDAYKQGWNTVGQYLGSGARKLGSAAGDVLLAMPAAAVQRATNVGIGGINALGANIPYMQESSPYAFSEDDANDAGGPPPTLAMPAPKNAAPTQDLPPASSAYKPVTAKDLGLPSLDASALYAAQRAGAGTGLQGDEFKKYYEAIRGMAGDNPDADAQRAEIAKNKKNAVNYALMHAGLGMAQAASEHPTQGFIGNLASGAGAGLGSYEKTETEQNAAQRELARLDRQEKLGIAGLAVNERGQDARMARQEAMARAGIAAQLKGPALQEAAIRQYAVDAANQDRAKGIVQPMSYYHQKAWEAYNSGLIRTGIGADAAMARTRVATAQKQLSSGMGTPAQQALWQRVIDSEGQFDPNEVPIPVGGASGAPVVRPQR